ncbi:AsmA family protein [Motilimonas eburnea]|uniref:YhdP family protein n=1 Tax=Motilimonas eburnea TaxID=1737488 RepID=UPI001E4B6A95|nr:AsmA family protein [Motilimonas eburnea]MCE2572696.1 AsmA family protein [Motilimonas eburnea]
MSPTGRLVVRLGGALLLTVFAIISLIVLLFDANDYRDDIKQWVKTELGYELTIQNIVWNATEPTLLTVEQLKLSLPNQPQTLVSIPKAWLTISTNGLWQRDITIDKLIIEHPEFYISDASFPPPQGASQASSPTNTSSEPMAIKSLTIDQLSINHLNAELAVSSLPPIKVMDFTLDLHHLKVIQQRQLLAEDTELDLELALASLAVRDFEIKDVFVAASLRQQQLDVAKLSGQYRNGKLRSTLGLNIVPPISMQVDELSLSDLNIEYNQALLDNFAAINPTETTPASADDTQSSPLQNLKIKTILVDDVSFTSYEPDLPLTFNKLDIELKNVPLLSAGHWLDLSQVEQLDSLFNLTARELYYAGTSISDLVIKSRVQGAKWDFYQVKGNSFNGHFSALFDLSLQRYPDIHITHFTARDLDIGIQPQWLASSEANDTEPKLLPINDLTLDKLDLYNLNLLSYADTLPLSVRGVSLHLTQAQLVKGRSPLSVPPAWSQGAELELTINETLYQGMKADRLKIKGRLNEDFLNPATLQRLVPTTPVIVEGVTIEQPEASVIRLD